MASTFGTHGSVESTIALLEAELPRLEEQQHTLERELAQVTERLEAARSALGGLQSLAAAPLLQEAATTVAAPERAPEVAEAAGRATKRRGAKSAPPKATTTARKRTGVAPARAARATAADKAAAAAAETRRPAAGSGKPGKATPAAKTTAVAKPAAARKAASGEPRKRTPGLSSGILAYLGKAEGPARAGDIAEALGREATPGSVNAVRTALERLVKASQAQRVGRGLYEALPR